MPFDESKIGQQIGENQNITPEEKPESSEGLELKKGGGVDEVNKEKSESRDGLEKDAKEELGNVFDGEKKGRGGMEGLLSKLEYFFEIGFFDKEKTKKLLEDCLSAEDRDEFIEKSFLILKPLIDLQVDNPELFRKIMQERNEKIMGERNKEEREQFTPVNELLSYGIGEDGWMHLHILPEKKDYVKKSLLKEGLNKLAQILNENKDIKGITATSWIVADNPGLMEKLGFTIGGPISDEERKKYFGREKREIWKSYISREDFIDKYLEKQNEEKEQMPEEIREILEKALEEGIRVNLIIEKKDGKLWEAPNLIVAVHEKEGDYYMMTYLDENGEECGGTPVNFSSIKKVSFSEG